VVVHTKDPDDKVTAFEVFAHMILSFSAEEIT